MAVKSQAPPFERIIESDRLVHEPARLAVLTALSACESADFVFLQRLTALQAGNLSQHLAKLAEAGFISLSKGFTGSYPQTTAQITDEGRRAVDDHWKRLDAVRKAADAWRRKGRE
jgi:DNA-binding transcriptional ArsR family regulator